MKKTTLDKESISLGILGLVTIFGLIICRLHYYAPLIGFVSVFIVSFFLIEKDKKIFNSIKKSLLFMGFAMLVITVPSNAQISGDKIAVISDYPLYINMEENLATLKSDKYIYKSYMIDSNKSQYNQNDEFSQFYKLGEIEIAVPSQNRMLGEYLIKYKDKEFKLRMNHPSDFLTISGIEKQLTLTEQEGYTDVYVNKETKEVFLSNKDIIVSTPYVETNYNKEDYFSYRASMFDETYPNKKDITEISFVKTFTLENSEVERISFYHELLEGEIESSLIELIYSDKAYVFRFGVLDYDGIINAKK